MTMNLGENCERCWCASCGYLEHCSTMCGNTKWYCENDCRGEDGCMTQCSQYEPNENREED